jgi:hypothetical protein
MSSHDPELRVAHNVGIEMCHAKGIPAHRRKYDEKSVISNDLSTGASIEKHSAQFYWLAKYPVTERLTYCSGARPAFVNAINPFPAAIT